MKPALMPAMKPATITVIKPAMISLLKKSDPSNILLVMLKDIHKVILKAFPRVTKPATVMEQSTIRKERLSL